MTDFSKRTASIALLVGVVFCLFPLTRELHFFSGFLLAIIASFTLGGIAAYSLTYRRDIRSGIRFLIYSLFHVVITAIPVLLLTLINGCFSGDGLALWILIVFPSVIFAIAIGRFVRFSFRKSLTITILVLGSIAIIPFLIELYLYPQVYFFNHIWGYWPGPVYEDFFELSASVLFYRFITLGWAIIFWLIPHFKTERWVKIPLGLATLSVMIAYSNLVNVGVVRPEISIAQQLGGLKQTDHAVLIFDKRIPDDEIALFASLHDFHLEELAQLLDLNLDDIPPIRSYIYYHRWQKREFTGAGRTNYVPVWNRNPQLHTHRQVTQQILRHELVHVLSREFGLPLINASISGAMIEGMAVALEGSRNPRITTHQTIAAREEFPDSRFLKSLFNPISFYSGSGPRNYAVSGSFIGWLMESYGPEIIKQAYACANLEQATGRTLEELTAEWHVFLETVETETGQDLLADAIFTSPGLIDRKCAFSLPPLLRDLETYNQLFAEADTAALIAKAEKMIDTYDNLPAQLYGIIAEQKLRSGNPQEVRLQEWWTKLPELFRFDTLLMLGEEEQAFGQLSDRAFESLTIQLLKESETGQAQYLDLKYGENGSCSNIDSILLPLWLEQAVRAGHKHLCTTNEIGDYQPTTIREFTAINRYIYQLIKHNEMEIAKAWFLLIENAQINTATQEQVKETGRFLDFLLTKES